MFSCIFLFEGPFFLLKRVLKVPNSSWKSHNFVNTECYLTSLCHTFGFHLFLNFSILEKLWYGTLFGIKGRCHSRTFISSFLDWRWWRLQSLFSFRIYLLYTLGLIRDYWMECMFLFIKWNFVELSLRRNPTRWMLGISSLLNRELTFRHLLR